MELRQTKRRKLATDNLLKQQKVQNLPLLCVESICKFTSTSRLARLYSNAEPMPGAFWDFGLKSVLKKRLPLSLGDDLPYHQAADPVAVFDASGAKVASIKHPDAFRFAPVRELIEVAALSLHATPKTASKLQLSVRYGESILLYLPKMTDLKLIVRGIHKESVDFLKDDDLLMDNLKHLIPLLHSFRIAAPCRALITRKFEYAFADFMREAPLHGMTSLSRLRLPERSFADLMESATKNPNDRAAFLSGLSSLSVWQPGAYQRRFELMSREGRLRFVSSHCRQVSTLSVSVAVFEVKSCLTALRELTNLTSLSLYLVDWSPSGTALAVNNCETISSVVDLRFRSGGFHRNSTPICAIASLFPNVKAIAFEFGNNGVLASEFCTKQVLPALETLTCFHWRSVSFCSIDLLAHFLSNSNLPKTVDLSQIPFEVLARDAGSLTAIYRAMQVNSTKSLLLRGPIHREALPRLQSHVDLNGDCVDLRAWKDRDLGDQSGISEFPEISPQTDIRIVGQKVSGRFDGEQFTIRVFHQDAKRSDIFD